MARETGSGYCIAERNSYVCRPFYVSVYGGTPTFRGRTARATGALPAPGLHGPSPAVVRLDAAVVRLDCPLTIVRTMAGWAAGRAGLRGGGRGRAGSCDLVRLHSLSLGGWGRGEGGTNRRACNEDGQPQPAAPPPLARPLPAGCWPRLNGDGGRADAGERGPGRKGGRELDSGAPAERGEGLRGGGGHGGASAGQTGSLSQTNRAPRRRRARQAGRGGRGGKQGSLS